MLIWLFINQSDFNFAIPSDIFFLLFDSNEDDGEHDEEWNENGCIHQCAHAPSWCLLTIDFARKTVKHGSRELTQEIVAQIRHWISCGAHLGLNICQHDAGLHGQQNGREEHEHPNLADDDHSFIHFGHYRIRYSFNNCQNKTAWQDFVWLKASKNWG